MAAVKALQQWCKIQCDGYRDVSITNMTTSFRDGLAFCALIHKHRPDLINFDSLRKEDIYDNNHKAFRVAEEQLGIPALLDAEDMVALKVPDRLSILTYVSQYYNYFHGRSPIGGMAGIKRPAESSSDEPSGKMNQPITAKQRSPAAPATENRPITAKPYTPGVLPAQNQPITAKTYTPAAPATPSQREVLSERTNKTGTLSSSCCVCNKHVHLVQRHLVDGKLYHRNCFRCSECSTILLSGTYKEGFKPGTFMCTTHNTPSSQSTQKPPSPKPSPRNPPTSNPRPWTSPSTNQNELSSKATPAPSKLTGPSWLVTKSDHTGSPTPTPSPRQQKVTVTVVSPSAPDKSSHDPKPSPTSFLKQTHTTPTPSLAPAPGPASSLSSSASKNQQARQKFFEFGTSSGTAKPLSGTADKGEPAGKSSGTGGSNSGTGTEKKGRKLLKVGVWKKDEEKDREAEKEKEREMEAEKEKEKAKSMIGKKLAEEKSSNTNPPWKTDGGKSTNNRGRVLLKPLDASLSTNTTPEDKPSPAWMNKTKKDNISVLTPSKENDTAPNSWRSMLKPVKSTDPSPAETPRSKPPSRQWGDSSGKPQALSPGLVAPSSLGTQSSKASKTPETTQTKETAKSPKLQGKPEYIPKEEILQELDDIERKVNELERKGVELEKQLREFEEEGKEDVLQDELMVDWFNLIRQKQVYMRRESELVYIAKNQDLEEQRPGVEDELRQLMNTPEHLKTSYDRKREEELMAKLVEIVNDRNAIVEGLDEDRLREKEEDEQLDKMMESLDVKKVKDKKKSKWFSFKSKKDGVVS